MKKINLKKVLGAAGLLAVALPATLSVVACGSTNVTVNKFDLASIFSNFQFNDDKNVQGFLDTNDLNIINEQVETYLGNSLDASGLTLKAHTTNSIILKANSDSKYQGEVKLTWNLKLFEVIGLWTQSGNSEISSGLKGYIYLDQTNQQIKYFDFVTYIKSYQTQFHPYFNDYHEFSFTNQDDQTKSFTFNGKSWTNNLPELFDSFVFNPEMEITTKSPEPKRIKIFNTSTKQWTGLTTTNNEETIFTFDDLGNIQEW